MTLDLPYPPTTNNAYTIARGRKIKTLAARHYAQLVQYRVLQAFPRGHVWLPDARFRVRIRAFPPDRRRRDLGNLEKGPVDAVFTALGLDDSAIDELTLSRGPVDGLRPRLEFTIEALP